MGQTFEHKRLHLLQYSLLSFPLLFVGLPLYVYAPEFYAAEFGIPLATIGLVLLGLRGVDAIQDLLIGSMSDRLHRYRKYVMYAGIIKLASGFWLVFNPSDDYTIWSFTIGMLLSATGFSILSINLQALGVLWKAEINERTRITSWREGIGLIGLLVASIAPTLLGNNTDAPRAFHLLAIIFLPILVTCAWVFFKWMQNADLEQPSHHKQKKGFSRLYTSWNKQFFGIYTFNTFASAIPAVLVIFYITDRLQEAELTGLFLLLYFLSGACGMPLWQWASTRIGKKRAWMISMILAATAFVWAFTLGAGDAYSYGFICILAGITLGADLALPPSILADQIAHQKDHDITSYYFSTTTFLSKTALALATGLTLPILGMLGYQPGEITDYAITDYLSYAYALIPSLLKACVAIWLWNFIKQTNEGENNAKIRFINNEHANIS